MTSGPRCTDVLARVNDELAAGNEVTIFTSRVDPDEDGADEARAAIESWCMEHLGTVLPVTAVKGRRFTEFWDDKAVPVRKVGRGEEVNVVDGDGVSDYGERVSNLARRFKSSRREAGNRGLVWCLTFGEYTDIVGAGLCHYCGGVTADQGSGLDRRDPDEGYTVANVVSACAHCNKAKLSHPYETWKRIADTFVAAHGKGAMWPTVQTDKAARQARAQRAADAKVMTGVARGVAAFALWAAKCCAPKSDRSTGWITIKPRLTREQQRARLEHWPANPPKKPPPEVIPAKSPLGFVWRGVFRHDGGGGPPVSDGQARRPRVRTAEEAAEIKRDRVMVLDEWRRLGLAAILKM